MVKLLCLAAGHQLHRDQLLDVLWPELTVDAAAANLRKAVHYARRALGSADAIGFAGGLLSLCPSAGLEVDVVRFERQAEEALRARDAGRCREVAATYTGDLLPADRYEPWAADARAHVHERFVEVLRGAGEWARVLGLDPTDEAAHRALMSQHVEAGNRREAIRQFERLRNALRDHIGVGPDATTVAVYEQVLAMEGDEPPSLDESTAALLCNGLVAWGRGEVAEAEQLARRARALALDAELSHEVGEASKLLALTAYAQGRWHEVFRAEFSESLRFGDDVAQAVYDAHLCFQEFYLYGEEGHASAGPLAREMLALAEEAGSQPGQSLALLLLGEVSLLSGDLDTASAALGESAERAERAGCPSQRASALQRLAETEVARGRPAQARILLAQALPVAYASSIPSHLIVRIVGGQVLAADTVVSALQAVSEGQKRLDEAPRVCDPCSMAFRIEAARACARAGDLVRARRYISDAQRIAGLWHGGAWSAALWEVHAELRRREGNHPQAIALFREAADAYATLHRPRDQARCRAAADEVGQRPSEER